MDENERQKEYDELLRKLEKMEITHLRQSYQIGDVLRKAVDDGDAETVEEIRSRAAGFRDGMLGSTDPLLEPYRLSLLVRHKPHLDDWGENNEILEQQTAEAVNQEIEAIAAESPIPLRLQLLLDSFVCLTAFMNERRKTDGKIISGFMKPEE